MALLVYPDPDANSFTTVDAADTYHTESRLHNSAWFDATVDNKEAALVGASSMLTRYILQRWNKTYLPTDGEAVKWLQDATAELAFWLLLEDRTADADTAGFRGIKVGSIALDIDRADRKKPIPDAVLDMIRPYLGSANMLLRA